MRFRVLILLTCYVAACSRGDEAAPPQQAADHESSPDTGCLESSGMLTSLREPVLSYFADSADIEVVRFVWQPSFHPRVSVRAMRRGDAYALVSAHSPIPPDRETPPPPEQDSVGIDAATWSRLTNPLVDDSLWVPEPPLPPNRIRLDGSTWSVEHLAKGRCRGIRYWSPDSTGRGARVRALGLLMFEAARITPEEIY